MKSGLRSLGGESIPCLFQLLVAAGIPWFVPTDFRVKGHYLEISLLHPHMAASVDMWSDLPVALSYKDTCDCI